MSHVTSPQKRQANRRNSLRSTGPKSLMGKQRSASNSRSHGLTTSIGAMVDGDLIVQLSECIAREGLDAITANQIAGKILDYERNLVYQRELYLERLKLLDANADGVKNANASLDRELALLDDYVDHQRFLGQAIGNRDLNFVVKTKQKMVQIWTRMESRKQRNKEKREEASVRYLRRSSNQLIKSLKALRAA